MKKYFSGIIVFLLVLFLGLLSFSYKLFIKLDVSNVIPKKDVEYTIVSVGEYSRPKFNKDDINKFIDKYIDENACMTFEYNVARIGDDKISMYLNCGTPESIIYNYKTKELLTVKDLIMNEEEYQNKVKSLLKLKYPTFVVDEVDLFNGTYNIKENEWVYYSNTKNYGSISIKINNNEIKDYINYNPKLDETYENEVYTLDPNKKTIAFSFDDGPSTYDLDIIDALVNSHAKATFFMVGNRMKSFKSSINKMIETDMETGNHTYDHKYMGKMSKANVLKEVNMANNIFNEITGRNLQIFRPPYGEVKASYLVDANLPSIIWSVDTLDWKCRDTTKVYNSIMTSKDGDIVLMHSLYPTTRDAVKKALPELYKKGIQVTTVSELAKIKGRTLEAGKSYWLIKKAN